MYNSFLDNPAFSKLSEQFKKLCSDPYATNNVLIFENGCLKLIYKDKVVSEWCEMKGMAEFYDSATTLNTSLAPNTSITLFDNGLLALSGTALTTNTQYIKGCFLAIKYPCVDNAGADIANSAKKATITIYAADGTSLALPLYKFWNWVGNPNTTLQADLIDKVIVTNPSTNTYDIKISAFILRSDEVQNSNCGC